MIDGHSRYSLVISKRHSNGIVALQRNRSKSHIDNHIGSHVYPNTYIKKIFPTTWARVVNLQLKKLTAKILVVGWFCTNQPQTFIRDRDGRCKRMRLRACTQGISRTIQRYWITTNSSGIPLCESRIFKRRFGQWNRLRSLSSRRRTWCLYGYWTLFPSRPPFYLVLTLCASRPEGRNIWPAEEWRRPVEIYLLSRHL